MAIDTASKRFSMLNFRRGIVLFPASGSITPGDRLHFLDLYSGIAPNPPPVVEQPSICCDTFYVGGQCENQWEVICCSPDQVYELPFALAPLTTAFADAVVLSCPLVADEPNILSGFLTTSWADALVFPCVFQADQPGTITAGLTTGYADAEVPSCPFIADQPLTVSGVPE